MLPDSLPRDAPQAEIAMFELIRDAKGLDDCFCLHSLGIARHRRKSYAEADLVFIGPHGVFCLEVKGGHVVRNAGTWTIGWPKGKTYNSKEGPFVQSEGTRWALYDYLGANFGTKYRNEILLGWGVAFPDIIFTETDPEWDQDLIFDQRDKTRSFGLFVDRLEHYFRQRLKDTGKPQPQRLGAARVREIVDSLRGDFEIIPSILGLMAESQEELIRLSRDQFVVLDYCLNDKNPRMICEGAAGTGKTLIAVEAARRLAKKGNKVLFLCYNDNLARFLSAGNFDEGTKPQISTIHRFIGEIIKKAGLAGELSTARESLSENAFFQTAYPRLFEDAAASLFDCDELPQFDVVIIDEAQDILTLPILNCVDLVLDRGIASGRWMFFLDSGVQSDVYGRLDVGLTTALEQYQPFTFTLTENFRNPKAIVVEMCTLTGLAEPICRRQLVSKVEYAVWRNEADQGEKLKTTISNLLMEGVAPSDICVLSARKRENACIIRFPPKVGKPITYLDPENVYRVPESIFCSSVSAFKGLESEFIILTDMPSLDLMDAWAKSIFYVGMTRARSKLFALVNQEFYDVRTR
ncbi:nuclease-related domain-containing DEAD/DEAH box helicase [Asticcacaulis taihuensis]|nr:NERD domain-containing protein [Asticcacaulis taihuensis]